MKTIIGRLIVGCVLACYLTTNTHAQSAAPYAVVERGADYRVLQKSTIENGTNRIHRYTELATGMNYTNSNGQLVESKEQITIQPQGGAAAVQGQHKVYFPADIYNGVLEVVTPDGRHLKSRPLGVSYDDGSNTVLIATLKHSTGWLTSSNQMTYPDAFTDFKADLVCTYRRGGFECDLVFRQQPPTPDAYGLDAANSTVQLITEFFNTADPQQIPAQLDDWFGLQDTTLKFGAMTMGRGKAFAVNSVNTQHSSANSQTPVYKRWLHLQGRTFLTEEVPLVCLADDLQTLPDATNALISKITGAVRMASNHRQMPPAPEFVSDTNQIQIASADLNKQPGVVLDYVEMDSDTNDFTFESGQTYFISSGLNIGGTTTFEGGTVIKFPENVPYWESGVALCIGNVVCDTTAYSPAVFTSENDDSVGVKVDSSSGSPAEGGNGYIDGGSFELDHCRFSYAGTAVASGDSIFNDVQFFQCYYGIVAGNITVNNVLASGCQWVFDAGPTCENCTFDQCGAICDNDGEFINCIFSSVGSIVYIYYDPSPSIDGSHNGFYNSPEFGDNALTNTDYPFQSGADGGYYLSPDAAWIDAGNVTADTLGLYWFTTQTSQTIEGTSPVDLGYHYPIEDFGNSSLPDWWQLEYFDHLGVDPHGDYDGDGDSNGTEYANGTDPTISADVSIYHVGDAIRPSPGFAATPGIFEIYPDVEDYATAINSNIVVHFTIRGPASNGVDYVLRDHISGNVITNSITIPAGYYEAQIEIDPTTNLLCISNLTVTITLVQETNDFYLIDASAPSATISVAPNVFSLVATVTNPCGLDYHPPTQSLIVSSKSNGTWSFLRIDANGVVTNWSGVQISGPDEVKLAIVKATANGFINGAMYFDSSGTGTIGWLSPDATVSNMTFVAVPGNQYQFYGLYVDQGGSFGGDLIAVQSPGIWRFKASGITNHFVISGIGFSEGIISLTNDMAQYGPWAGKIITGDAIDAAPSLIYLVDTNGTVTNSPLNSEVEDCDIVMTNQNLYCNDSDDGWVLKVSKDIFTNHVGDVLITVSGVDVDSAALYIVHWNAATTNFVKTKISSPYVSNFEHVTFAPIDISPMSP